ncbi:hypothetical protein Hamer_G026223 [Homarus americanus]|uniref:Uncharacterized protein n=1 Tax=Homarus americanus TaxID=6706 RepID=A0A8J5JCB1_HOMAM|nr:hypothetical protein Hamer_G026223 [Homarus americanus]
MKTHGSGPGMKTHGSGPGVRAMDQGHGSGPGVRGHGSGPAMNQGPWIKAMSKGAMDQGQERSWIKARLRAMDQSHE